MLNIFKILCLLVLSIWMISSCTRDKSADPQPQNGGSNGNTIICDTIIVWDSITGNSYKVNVCDTLITYAAYIEPIISAKCAVPNCHGTGFASGGVTLDTYEKVKAKADDGKIEARAIDGIPSPMPPLPLNPLTASEKTAIQNWIDEGALP